MTWPWVRRRTFLAARQRADTLRSKYDAVWADHRKRCDCHDAWDQCPCKEGGHPKDHSCDCCDWCC